MDELLDVKTAPDNDEIIATTCLPVNQPTANELANYAETLNALKSFHKLTLEATEEYRQNQSVTTRDTLYKLLVQIATEQPLFKENIRLGLNPETESVYFSWNTFEGNTKVLEDISQLGIHSLCQILRNVDDVRIKEIQDLEDSINLTKCTLELESHFDSKLTRDMVRTSASQTALELSESPEKFCDFIILLLNLQEDLEIEIPYYHLNKLIAHYCISTAKSDIPIKKLKASEIENNKLPLKITYRSTGNLNTENPSGLRLDLRTFCNSKILLEGILESLYLYAYGVKVG